MYFIYYIHCNNHINYIITRFFKKNATSVCDYFRSFRLVVDSSELILPIKLFVVMCVVELSLKLFRNTIVSVLYLSVFEKKQFENG